MLQMLIHRYNSEEWENVVAKDPDWTREETDYLLDLCDQFCLKFMVVADRYEVQIQDLEQESLCLLYALFQRFQGD